jgi:hypothetical protein
MTSTPDDQEWLRLAEEAFNGDRPESEAMQDKWEQQPPWRYRSPAT